MVRPDLPSAVYEPARLAAVERSGLVDTGAEETFDRLAALASTLLEAPLAFVTVVDTERSWYKACIGLPPGADRFGPVEESFCQYVVGTNERLIVDDARQDERTARNPAIEKLGVAAWAGFPVRAPDGEVLGTLCVVDTVPRGWTDRDVLALEGLAEAASREIALREALADSQAARLLAEQRWRHAERLSEERAQIAEHASRLARTLQRSLLPPSLPEVPGLDVAAEHVPAATGEEVLGDFYDLYEGVDGSWCVLVGDVCGKGPEAAAVTALARYTLRSEALRTKSPAEMLRRLNDAMLHQHQDFDAGRFVTVALMRLRIETDRVMGTVSSAGHLLPLVRRHAEPAIEVGEPCEPLGVFEQVSPVDTDFCLSSGDTVVLVTDGVTEARRGDELFGSERLTSLLDQASGSAAQICTGIHSAVADFCGGAAPRDDTAVVVVRVR